MIFRYHQALKVSVYSSSSVTGFFGLTFCFYCPCDLFRKIAVEAGLTVSWTERLLRYFYHIFTLTIAVLPCLNRKKSKVFGVLPLTPTGVLTALLKKPMIDAHIFLKNRCAHVFLYYPLAGGIPSSFDVRNIYPP